jgi:hypothetical protein
MISIAQLLNIISKYVDNRGFPIITRFSEVIRVLFVFRVDQFPCVAREGFLAFSEGCIVKFTCSACSTTHIFISI